MENDRLRSREEAREDATSSPVATPGRRTLTMDLAPGRAVQALAGAVPAPAEPRHPTPRGEAAVQRRGGGAARADAVHDAAAHGISGSASELPHLAQIQRAFGDHDVRHVQAHTDGAAAAGARAMGATAFAMGDHVAFAGAPDLHTAAHEAAHVVQQRGGVQLKGGVGEVGDVYERHADAVADAVVRGQSAAALLDGYARQGAAPASTAGPVQRKFDGELEHQSDQEIYDGLRGYGAKVSVRFRLSELRDSSTTYATFEQLAEALGLRRPGTEDRPPPLEGLLPGEPPRREPPSPEPRPREQHRPSEITRIPLRSGAPLRHESRQEPQSNAPRTLEPFEQHGFERLETPLGSGLMQIWATRVFWPSGPIELPGARFDEICPSQPHVSQGIVEAKLAAGLGGIPTVPVSIFDGRLVLYDGHHTFVACLAIGHPVRLGLTKMPGVGGDTSWRGCTWSEFEEKPGAKRGGLKVEPLDYDHEMEGPWQEVVPWRQGQREVREPVNKGAVIERKLSHLKLTRALLRQCGDHEALLDDLWMLLDRGVVICERNAPKGSTGGAWDKATNTISIDRDAPDVMVDMLIFEMGNAKHQPEFRELEKRARDVGMGPQQFGTERALIEAQTTLDHLHYCLDLVAMGRTIPEKGQRAIAWAERLVPGYGELSIEDRELHKPTLARAIVSSKHGVDDELPKHSALSTEEMYAYDKVTVTWGAPGIRSFLKSQLPEGDLRERFLEVLVAHAPTVSYAYGRYYLRAVAAAERLFAVALDGFSDLQGQLADLEYDRSGWSDDGLVRALDELP